MFARLFLLFTLVPLIELYLLIQLGGVLGTGPTIALVLVTGTLGAALAKREGVRIFGEWQSHLAQGKMPSEGLTGALLALVGGVLLITPGVITDFFGLSLLIPPIRKRIASAIQASVKQRMVVQQRTIHLGQDSDSSSDFSFSSQWSSSSDPRAHQDASARTVQETVIDVEATPR